MRTGTATASPVLSTCRLQLRGGFNFADAEKLVEYLDDLGVTHRHSSPIHTATPGSEHGCDVVDPTTVSEKLGRGRCPGSGGAADLMTRKVGRYGRALTPRIAA